MTAFARRKPRWKPGMVYAVPLHGGSYGIAQAIDSMMTNVIYVAVFPARYDVLPATATLLSFERAIALLATPRKALNRGDWPALGVVAAAVGKDLFPNESFAPDGYVGAKIYAAGLISAFLSAYHGLIPWNGMADEDYFERMLAPGATPESKVVLPPPARAEYRRIHADGQNDPRD